MRVGEFKKKHSEEKRIMEASRIKEKHPERTPIIVESNVFELDKFKFLVQNDLTIGQFIFILRKRITLAPEKAIFLLVNNTLPMVSTTLSSLHINHGDKDGFLYISLTEESTFGN